MSDDILVHGKTQEDHDRAFRETFTGLTLHREKCEFSRDSLEFFGYVFSGKGLSADPKKVEAITNLPSPTYVAKVRSLLGMANYCSRFIPVYATQTQPLREVTQREDSP